MFRKTLPLIVALAALAVFPSAASATATASCPANAYECDTGINVHPGDEIVATASPDFNTCGGIPSCFTGEITPSSATEYGSSYVNLLSFQYSYFNGVLSYGYAAGGFYRIGSGGYWTAFIAGENLSISNPVIADSPGRLYVTTNDLYYYYYDNIGSISVTVTALPVKKAECAKGGWEAFGVFKNHGDCVSYVASDGKNPPNG